MCPIEECVIILHDKDENVVCDAKTNPLGEVTSITMMKTVAELLGVEFEYLSIYLVPGPCIKFSHLGRTVELLPRKKDIVYSLFWMDKSSYGYPLPEFRGTKEECIEHMVNFTKNDVNYTIFDIDKCRSFYEKQWKVHSRQSDGVNTLIPEYDPETDGAFGCGWVAYLY